MKKDITFYHLTSKTIEKTLPNLAFKVFESGQRALILCKDEYQMDELNHILWSFSTKKFIPHGSIKDDSPELQPILLSTSIDDLHNSPEIAIILNEQDIQGNSRFKKYSYMFYGNENDAEVISARKLMKSYYNAGHAVKSWILDPKDNWLKD
jgi:DNA polymerase III subunit chi